VLSAAAVFIPAHAEADQYVVDFCKDWVTDGPGKTFEGLTGFGASGEVSDCGVGGAAAGVHQLHAGARMSYDTTAGIRLTIPASRPAITIDRILTRHRLSASAGSVAFLRFIGGGALLDNAPGEQTRIDDRSLPEGTRSLEWSVYCSYSAGPTPCQWNMPDDVLHLYKARLFLSEFQPPTLEVTGGTIRTHSAQAGMRTVAFDAADADSGLATVTVNFGDIVVGERTYVCIPTGWSACPRASAGQWLSVDTREVPDGMYEATVVATDAARNSTVRPLGEVTIDNRPGAPDADGTVPVSSPNLAGPQPGTANGRMASRRARLSAGFGSSQGGNRRARVTFGAKPVLRGRLVDEQGRPIAGASVEVQTRPRSAGARLSHVATAVTDGSGTFSYRLPPGPSRAVTMTYAAFAGEAPSARATLATDVRATIVAASFVPRSPRPGKRVSFSGRLQHLGRSGIEIDIQFRDRARWRTVGVTKTHGHGRFVWFYRFVRGLPGDVFEFRAHVDSPIYPFAPGSSATVQVPISR
jgi:hypothetical protein